MKRTVELSEKEVIAILKEKFNAAEVKFKFGEKILDGGDWRDPPKTKKYLKGAVIIFNEEQ
jgi:hypothetical protein